MDYKRLPIWRQATALMVEMELAVRVFPRYHKYTLGHELRLKTQRIGQVIHRAFTRKQSKHKLAR